MRHRCRAKALQSRPNGLLHFGRHSDVFLSNQTQHPSLCFGDPGFAINVPQGLERKVAVEAEVVPGTAKGKRRAARRATLVEDEDLRPLVAAELQGEER